MNYYYICSKNIDPYHNLAMEQCLFSCVEDNTAVLFLWQNEHAIVIGRNQDVYVECRAEAFLKDGGTIARRRSGGGAVYHDLGNLNYSIICPAYEADSYPYPVLIRSVLNQFGIQMEFNGRNDLTVRGKKFSGNASYKDDRMVCLHGTLLIEADLEKMTTYLTPDRSKLNRNQIKSVAARVVNLQSLSKEITVSRMCQAMIETLQAEPLLRIPNADEIQKLEQCYADTDWVYGGRYEVIGNVRFCARANR